MHCIHLHDMLSVHQIQTISLSMSEHFPTIQCRCIVQTYLLINFIYVFSCKFIDTFYTQNRKEKAKNILIKAFQLSVLGNNWLSHSINISSSYVRKFWIIKNVVNCSFYIKSLSCWPNIVFTRYKISFNLCVCVCVAVCTISFIKFFLFSWSIFV